MGNYVYCSQNKSILHDLIRENPVLSCLFFVIKHKSFFIKGASTKTLYKLQTLTESKVYVPFTLTIRDDLTWSVCVNEGIEIF